MRLVALAVSALLAAPVAADAHAVLSVPRARQAISAYMSTLLHGAESTHTIFLGCHRLSPTSVRCHFNERLKAHGEVQTLKHGCARALLDHRNVKVVPCEAGK
jgi:hypothetical protein